MNMAIPLYEFCDVAKPSPLSDDLAKSGKSSIGRFNESENLAKYGYKLDMKIV